MQIVVGGMASHEVFRQALEARRPVPSSTWVANFLEVIGRDEP